MPLSEINTLSNTLAVLEKTDFTGLSTKDVLKRILEGARESKVSDIVFIPGKEVDLRYRMHGNLVSVGKLPGYLYSGLLSMVKDISGLDTNDHLRPKEGKGSIEINDEVVDIGVSVSLTDEGEKCTISIFDSEIRKFNLENIGLEESQLKQLRKGCKEKNGLILIAGDRSSGKTTTAYSVLEYLRGLDKSVITVENPLFYNLLGMKQMEHTDYEGVLYKLLQTYPDVVFVDTLGTKEAGDLISSAVINGILVISTINVKKAEDTISKLKKFGMDDFFISNALKLVVFQELSELVCSKCNGRGCRVCSKTGFIGKGGSFSILTASELT